MERNKSVCFVMLMLLAALLLSICSGRLAAAAETSGEETVNSFVGRWKDKPLGAETMTFDLLSDHNGELTLLGETYSVQWEVENTFKLEGLDLETVNLKLYVNGNEIGTATYMNPPESLSLNLNGNEFIFSFKEELAGETAFNLKKGIHNGNTYIQEYLGFTIPFPDDWELVSEEDLSLKYSGLPEIVTDDNLQQYLEAGSVIIDTYAHSADKRVSCYVKLQNFGSAAELLKMTPESYFVLLLKKNEAALRSNLEAKGVTDIQLETGTVMLQGKSCPAIAITGKLNNEDYNQKFTAISQGNYGAMIYAVSVGEDQTDWVFSIIE